MIFLKQVTLDSRIQASSGFLTKRTYSTLDYFKYTSALITNRMYNSIVEDVNRLKVFKMKESFWDYQINERNDVLIVQGCKKFIESFSNAQ